jgi:hypothetical protein
MSTTEADHDFVIFDSELGIDEVHRRHADEAGDKGVERMQVKIGRVVDLLDEAIFHDDDAGTHGHGFGLVMGNVDEGGLQALMQFGDLNTHLDTQFGVEVGKRLVHQEDLRVTDDGAAESNTLALTAGEGFRLAVEQMLDFEDRAASVTRRLISSLGTLRSFKPNAMLSKTVMCG